MTHSSLLFIKVCVSSLCHLSIVIAAAVVVVVVVIKIIFINNSFNNKQLLLRVLFMNVFINKNFDFT